jgi:ADP-heptose:LPS heptosyltransferase
MQLLKNIKLFAKDAVGYLEYYLAFLQSSKKNKRVAMIKLDGIGDFIIFNYKSNELVQHYKKQGYRVDLYCSDKVSDIAHLLNLWDRVIPVNIKSFKNSLIYRLKALFNCVNQKYFIAINFSYSRDPLLGSALISVAKAKRSITYSGDNLNNSSQKLQLLDRRIYTDFLSCSDANEIERLKNLSAYITGRDEDSAINSIKTIVDTSKNKKYILFLPCSSDPKRTLSCDRWALEINRNKSEGELVVCGALEDKSFMEKITRKVSNKKVKIIITDTVLDLIKMINQSITVIGPESAGIHIARALGISNICFLGGGHFGKFIPSIIDSSDSRVITHKMDCYGCNWNCIHDAINSYPCIENIEP